MSTGSLPVTAMVWMRASGRNPKRSTACSEANSMAAEPSVIWLDMAAVSGPNSLKGLRVDIFSMLVSGRMPSSRATPPTGSTSGSKRPSSHAL